MKPKALAILAVTGLLALAAGIGAAVAERTRAARRFETIAELRAQAKALAARPVPELDELAKHAFGDVLPKDILPGTQAAIVSLAPKTSPVVRARDPRDPAVSVVAAVLRGESTYTELDSQRLSPPPRSFAATFLESKEGDPARICVVNGRREGERVVIIVRHVASGRD